MPPDELDDEERALLEKHRAAKAKKAEEDKEVWIKGGDKEAAIPYSKARKWLQDNFGIDLDQEPEQEPDAKPGEGEPGEAGKVQRFGRRVS